MDIANTTAAAPNQQWKLVSVGGNSYQLVGNRSGKVLDVANAQTAQGTPVDIAFAVPGASNQTWQLAAVDGQYYQIVSTASGKVLDVVGAGTAPGTGIDIATAVPGAFNQEWQFVELPYFQIVSRASGQVLDVYAAQTNNGTPVDIAPAVAGAPNQEWMLVPAGTPLPPAVFTISGQVTSGGIAFSGAVITLGGSQSASTTTDASGHYSFSVVAGGSYTVAPSLSGFSFSPVAGNFVDLRSNEEVNFVASYNGGGGAGGGGSIDFNPIDPPSQLYELPNAGATSCDTIAGTWTQSSSPPATWHLAQAENNVSGTVTSSLGQTCGAITWQVSGTGSAGSFNLAVSSPSQAQDTCGNEAAANANSTITLSAPSCSTGSGTITWHYSSGRTSSATSTFTSNSSTSTVYPAKLSSSLLSSKTFVAQQVDNCDGTPKSPTALRWGYRNCYRYTLLDQFGAPMKNPAAFTMSETVHAVDTNYATDYSMSGLQLNDAAQCLDEISLFNPAGPIPTGKYNKAKQTIYATDTASGQPYTVRINCLSFTSTGVTMTDTTSNPSNSCR